MLEGGKLEDRDGICASSSSSDGTLAPRQPGVDGNWRIASLPVRYTPSGWSTWTAMSPFRSMCIQESFALCSSASAGASALCTACGSIVELSGAAAQLMTMLEAVVRQQAVILASLPASVQAFAGLDTSADTWFRNKSHAVWCLPNRGEQLEHCRQCSSGVMVPALNPSAKTH